MFRLHYPQVITRPGTKSMLKKMPLITTPSLWFVLELISHSASALY